MENKTSMDPDYNINETQQQENKNITCKDGYCFIPNLEENKATLNENINIFDPIQRQLIKNFSYQIIIKSNQNKKIIYIYLKG